MGLLLLPLGVGLCMAFAGVYARWSKLLMWGSLSALLLGVLNSIRMSFMPTTLWQLGVYIAMIGIGGGLMFKGLRIVRMMIIKPTLVHQSPVMLTCSKSWLS